ncbi:hypothetical protein [Dankookia sp. P2]|uniref:hypothetical protein n=1 Tax=Dankookia sp. P2 TaxID=3423955 RepID=UPI003D668C82
MLSRGFLGVRLRLPSFVPVGSDCGGLLPSDGLLPGSFGAGCVAGDLPHGSTEGAAAHW